MTVVAAEHKRRKDLKTIKLSQLNITYSLFYFALLNTNMVLLLCQCNIALTSSRRNNCISYFFYLFQFKFLLHALLQLGNLNTSTNIIHVCVNRDITTDQIIKVSVMLDFGICTAYQCAPGLFFFFFFNNRFF